MKRITYALVLLLSLLPALVVAQEATAEATSDTSGSAAVQFIRENPNDVAIACYDPNNPETGVFRNADESFPLASAFKIVILAAYAQQVDEGLLDPQENIPLKDVNRFFLPGTDGGAHESFLKTLPEGTTDTKLTGIAQAMIQFSDNAAADYLLTRIGTDKFSDLYTQVGLTNTSLPLLYSGTFLVQTNEDDGIMSADQVASLDETSFKEAYTNVVDKFLNDTAWHDAQVNYAKERAENSSSMSSAEINSVIEGQTAYFARFGNQGSARDLATLMEAAYSDESALSDGTQQVMQQHLNWLFEANPDNQDVYTELGFKGGSLPGILTSAWYVQPINGQPLVLSVLYRDIPFQTWNEWSSSSNAQQKLELRAITTGEGCDVFPDAATIRQGSVGSSLAGTQWRLVSYGTPGSETPVSSTGVITLNFPTSDKVTGAGGCNEYTGTYSATQAGIVFSDITSTRRACTDSIVTQQEQTYLDALRTTTNYTLVDGHLTISYADNKTLNFTVGGVNADILTGSAWQLELYGPQASPTAVIPSSNVTLNFVSDNHIEGNGGCNGYGGSYQTTGNTITFSQIIHTEIACVDQPKTSQEQAFFAALQSAATYEGFYDRLIISYPGGELNFKIIPQQTTPVPSPTPISTTVVPPSTIPPQTCSQPWIVQPGDTLYSIAQACGTSVDALLAANPQITDRSLLLVGEVITIPGAASVPTQTNVTPQRIQFQPGTTSAQVTGQISGAAGNTYVLNALSGQTMHISLDNASLTIVSPSGQPLVRGTVTEQPVRNFDRLLTESGDYQIYVSVPANSVPVNYTMNVSITG